MGRDRQPPAWLVCLRSGHGSLAATVSRQQGAIRCGEKLQKGIGVKHSSSERGDFARRNHEWTSVNESAKGGAFPCCTWGRANHREAAPAPFMQLNSKPALRS